MAILHAAQTRVIRKSDTEDCQTWQPPVVEGPIVSDPASAIASDPPTPERLEAVYRHAYDEGFELGRREGKQAGYDEGRVSGRSDYEQSVQLFQQLLENLSRPIDKLDMEMEQSIVELAVMIARHVIRRELKTDPGEIVGVVREALSHLPIASRNPKVHLNPDDIELVRKALALGENEPAWRLDPDPLISRGGCLVETTTSFIDATVEARIAAIVAQAMGGDREGDRS